MNLETAVIATCLNFTRTFMILWLSPHIF